MPTVVAAESKADRGWRLRTGRPRDAVKQVDIALADDVTAAEGSVVSSIGGADRWHERRRGGDIEGVHQMRVAIRRLRAALVLFRPRLEPHAEARLTEALLSRPHIWRSSRLGRVLQGNVGIGRGARGGRSWLTCCVNLRRRNGPRRTRELRDALQRPTMTATVLGLAAWGAPDNEAMRIQLVHGAPKLVERLERRVVRRGHISRTAPMRSFTRYGRR